MKERLKKIAIPVLIAVSIALIIFTNRSAERLGEFIGQSFWIFLIAWFVRRKSTPEKKSQAYLIASSIALILGARIFYIDYKEAQAVAGLKQVAHESQEYSKSVIYGNGSSFEKVELPGIDPTKFKKATSKKALLAEFQPAISALTQFQRHIRYLEQEATRGLELDSMLLPQNLKSSADVQNLKIKTASMRDLLNRTYIMQDDFNKKYVEAFHRVAGDFPDEITAFEQSMKVGRDRTQRSYENQSALLKAFDDLGMLLEAAYRRKAVSFDPTSQKLMFIDDPTRSAFNKIIDKVNALTKAEERIHVEQHNAMKKLESALK